MMSRGRWGSIIVMTACTAGWSCGIDETRLLRDRSTDGIATIKVRLLL